MPTSADREKSLETALAQIDRQFGKGSVMRLGSDERAPVEVIPTGSIALDVALGIGGLPRGRIVEIYGPESSGKTTLTLHAIANAQRAGGIAAFIDAEHALDPEYAKSLGVDIDALLVSQPDTGEQALEIADMLVRSGSIDLIVIDSVAALVPRAEIEGEMGDSHVGLQARLMSQALRKLTGGLSSTNTTMIFINQLREKIGVFFGSPETTAGGKALKFYASVRLDIRRIETLKDGTDAVGNRTRVKVVKNKMAPPFKQAEFDILYGTGISREGSLIDFGVDHEIVRKSGAWYTYDGDQLGQGKENSRNFLIENPAVALDIEQKIMMKLGIGAEAKAAALAASRMPRCGGGSGRRSRRRRHRSFRSSRPSRSRVRGACRGVRRRATPGSRRIVDDGDRLATVTYLSERIAAVAAVPPEATRLVEERREATRLETTFAEVSDVAMKALTRRGMSSSEMRTYLIGREFSTEVADAEVERLESVGLLDDLHLAETLVRTLRERKGLGRSALKGELGRRKLDPDAIAAALETVEGDEQAMALELARKRAGAAALVRPRDGDAAAGRVPAAQGVLRWHRVARGTAGAGAADHGTGVRVARQT